MDAFLQLAGWFAVLCVVLYVFSAIFTWISLRHEQLRDARENRDEEGGRDA
jgi:hypothetical protein